MNMNRIVEATRYFVLVGIFFLMVGAMAAFGWGAIKAFNLVRVIIRTLGKDPEIAVSLIQLVDAFLIATLLLIVAASLYELFIGHLNLTDAMVAHNFNELKIKLSNVIILVMAITFLEHLVDWKDPQGTLYFGLAVSVVSAVLIAFSYLGTRSSGHD